MSEPLYPVDSFEDRLVDQMDRRGEITSFFMETLLPLLPTNEIKVHIPSVPGLRAVYKLVGVLWISSVFVTRKANSTLRSHVENSW